MRVKGLPNFRDLGGLSVIGGGTTRAGRLFRSEAPLLDPPELAIFESLGLRTVIDLRDVDESSTTPPTLPTGVTRTCVPITPPYDATGHDLGHQLRAGTLEVFGEDELTAVTIGIIDTQAAPIGQAIRHLAAEHSLPALVHCTARTVPASSSGCCWPRLA